VNCRDRSWDKLRSWHRTQQFSGEAAKSQRFRYLVGAISRYLRVQVKARGHYISIICDYR
jgi:hypothetical protein